MIFALLSFLVASGALARPSDQIQEYALATGRRGGLYYLIGLGIRETASRGIPPVKLRAIESSGSVENLDWIRSGRADFALIQNDIAQSDGLCVDSFGILASLYTEPVQICVRRQLCLTSPKDLRGKRLSLGIKGSGTERNALAVLGAAGITSNEVTASYLDFDSSTTSLENGAIDAAFYTVGFPYPNIQRLLDDGTAYILSLDAETIKRLREEYPAMVLCDIPKGSYTSMRGGVSTVGVTACLVCSARVPRKDVESVLASLYQHRERFDLYFSPLAELTELQGVKGVRPERFHPAARELYAAKGVFLLAKLRGIWDTFFPGFVLLVLVTLLYFFRGQIARYLDKREPTRHFGRYFAKVTIGILVVLIPTGVALFYLERGVNQKFGTFPESIWSIIVYVTSGFEDRAPLTTWGRAVSVMGIVAWAIIASLFTAVLAGLQVRGVIMGNDKLDSRFSDHVVVLGWNERARGILTEVLKWGRYVAIMYEKAGLPMSLAAERVDHSRIKVVDADPRCLPNLKRLKLEQAHAVVVLPTPQTGHSPDEFTLATVIRVRRFLESVKGIGKRPHLLAEALDPESALSIRDAGADEVVCTTGLGQNLLANCAANPGVSLVIENLLSVTQDTNEIYLADLPPCFHGKSYQELCSWLYQNCDKDDPVLLLGLKRADGSIVPNPREASKIKLEEGDKAFVIAYDRKSLNVLNRAPVSSVTA